VPGTQLVSGDHPIERQQAFGNIVAAVYSALLRDITTKGPRSRFRKAGRGLFALATAV
jgi:hypothetical protein